jgi:hypothetical protein
MSVKILQLNFRFSVSADDYTAAVSALADDFAVLPGLQWKIWMINDEEKEAGGIYLFENEASLKAYLEGELAAQVMKHPALSDFSAKLFNVMDEVTAKTRGPVL